MFFRCISIQRIQGMAKKKLKPSSFWPIQIMMAVFHCQKFIIKWICSSAAKWWIQLAVSTMNSDLRDTALPEIDFSKVQTGITDDVCKKNGFFNYKFFYSKLFSYYYKKTFIRQAVRQDILASWNKGGDRTLDPATNAISPVEAERRREFREAVDVSKDGKASRHELLVRNVFVPNGPSSRY